jgi:acyl carrier protein
MNKTEIPKRPAEPMTEHFVVDAAVCRPQARPDEDHCFDCIDAVDRVVQIRPLIGKRRLPEPFKAVRIDRGVADDWHGLIAEGAAK